MATESKWIPIATRPRAGTERVTDANHSKRPCLRWTELPGAIMTMEQVWHAVADGRILLACRHTENEVIAVIFPVTIKPSPRPPYDGRKYR